MPRIRETAKRLFLSFVPGIVVIVFLTCRDETLFEPAGVPPVRKTPKFMDVLNNPVFEFGVERLQDPDEVLFRNQMARVSGPAVCENDLVCDYFFPASLVDHSIEVGVNAALEIKVESFEEVDLLDQGKVLQPHPVLGELLVPQSLVLEGVDFSHEARCVSAPVHELLVLAGKLPFEPDVRYVVSQGTGVLFVAGVPD